MAQKIYGPSNSFEVIKLKELIENYVIEKKDYARVELLNKVINGDDLAEALGYLQSKIEDEYEDMEEDEGSEEKKSLIGNLESIIKGKEGKIINEIKKVINEYKITEK